MSTSDPPYRFEDAQGYSIIVVQPRLNDSQWSEFENVGNELLGRLNQAKSPACLVDLSGLNYMGSAMVALIVRLWKTVKARGGKMVVINQHPMVHEVIKLAGLHNVWDIVETRDQGLKQLGKRSGGGGGDGSAALIGLGVLGVAVGLVGLALLLKYIPSPLSTKVSMAVTMGGAAVGLFAGAVCAAKGTGSKQKAGIAFAIASAAILIAGILNMDSGQAAPAGASPPAATGSASSASAENTNAAPALTPVAGKRNKEDDGAASNAAVAGDQSAADAAAQADAAAPADAANNDGAQTVTPAGDAKVDEKAQSSEGQSKGFSGLKALGKKND